MRGLGLVAMREIKQGLRSKTFLITTVVTILMVGAVAILPQVLGGDPQRHSVGLVGEGGTAIVDAAVRLGNAADEPDAEQPSVEIETTEFTDRAAAEAALEAGEVDAVLVDDSVMLVRTTGFAGVGVSGLLQQAAAARALEEVLAEHGETAALVIETLTSDALEVINIADGGAGEDEGGSRWIVAQVGMILLYLAILIYGSWILTGVTEEKSSRVVEVLLSALRPWQLLGGKVLGIGALGLTQFVLTIAVALIAVRYSDIEIPSLDPIMIANLILWFILGFLTYAVLFGAAGSLVSRSEDAQSVAFPMSMLAVGGFFLGFAALEDPEGTAAVVGTLIPLTAPFVVPIRVALDAIPGWQFAASVAIVLVSILVLVRIAGRIYSGALLRFGGRTKFREAWRGANQ